jgi:hypothetical protein
MRIVELSVTTSAAGAGTTTLDLGAPYLLYKVEYNLGTFDAGIDATLANVSTYNGTDESVLTLTDANADAVHHPRVLEAGSTGAALTTTTTPLAGNVIKLTIASGGATKTGGMKLYLVEL